MACCKSIWSFATYTFLGYWPLFLALLAKLFSEILLCCNLCSPRHICQKLSLSFFFKYHISVDFLSFVYKILCLQLWETNTIVIIRAGLISLIIHRTIWNSYHLSLRPSLFKMQVPRSQYLLKFPGPNVCAVHIGIFHCVFSIFSLLLLLFFDAPLLPLTDQTLCTQLP